MAAIVQVDPLPFFSIRSGSLSGELDLLQDRCSLDNRVGVSKDDALETVGEVAISTLIDRCMSTRPLIKNLLHDVHVD